jgi:hypothetical protein
LPLLYPNIQRQKRLSRRTLFNAPPIMSTSTEMQKTWRSRMQIQAGKLLDVRGFRIIGDGVTVRFYPGPRSEIFASSQHFHVCSTRSTDYFISMGPICGCWRFRARSQRTSSHPWSRKAIYQSCGVYRYSSLAVVRMHIPRSIASE